MPWFVNWSVVGPPTASIVTVRVAPGRSVVGFVEGLSVGLSDVQEMTPVAPVAVMSQVTVVELFRTVYVLSSALVVVMTVVDVPQVNVELPLAAGATGTVAIVSNSTSPMVTAARRGIGNPIAATSVQIEVALDRRRDVRTEVLLDICRTSWKSRIQFE